MRSSTKTVLSTVFAGALLFGTAACSSDEEAKPATSSSSSSEAVSEPEAEKSETAEETAEETTEETAAIGEMSLQEIVDLQNEAIAPQLESLKEIFSEVKILAKEPNGIIYSYQYAIDVPKDATADGIEAGEDQLSATADSVFPSLEAAGIANPSITFTYLNSDGSEIWSKEYTK